MFGLDRIHAHPVHNRPNQELRKVRSLELDKIGSPLRLHMRPQQQVPPLSRAASYSPETRSRSTGSLSRSTSLRSYRDTPIECEVAIPPLGSGEALPGLASISHLQVKHLKIHQGSTSNHNTSISSNNSLGDEVFSDTITYSRSNKSTESEQWWLEC